MEEIINKLKRRFHGAVDLYVDYGDLGAAEQIESSARVYVECCPSAREEILRELDRVVSI